MGRKFGLSFSWKRALGVSSAKQKFARMTGIPTTKQGRQRKVGKVMTGGGCLLLILAILAFAFISCTPEARVQTEVDQEFIRTQVAQTLMAEWAATETPVPEPTIEPTKQPGTRDNPIPLGQSLDIVTGNDTFFSVTVLEVIRGDQAWQMIHQANMFNEAPDEGKEYILAKIKIEYLSSTTPDKTLSVTTWNFGTISNNQIFENLFIVNPSPELNLELFPGGSGEGYISGIVFKDDPGALIYYAELFSDLRFYFALS